MTSPEDIRAGLAREREARKAAYVKAVGERDALPADADRFTVRRAEARVGLALGAMKDWGDPVPTATETISTAPECYCSLSRPAGAVDPVETVVARILNA